MLVRYYRDQNTYCARIDKEYGTYASVSEILRHVAGRLAEGEELVMEQVALQLVAESQRNTAALDIPSSHKAVRKVQLQEGFAERLRSDPDGAIAGVDAPTYASLDEVRRRMAALSAMRASEEQIVRLQGRILYARHHLAYPDRVECPGCGLWQPCQRDGFTCARTSGCIAVERVDVRSRWSGFHLADLLALPLQRFYFPLSCEGWVTHGDLAALADKLTQLEQRLG